MDGSTSLAHAIAEAPAGFKKLPPCYSFLHIQMNKIRKQFFGRPVSMGGNQKILGVSHDIVTEHRIWRNAMPGST